MAAILSGIGAILAALVAGTALYFNNRTTNANLRSQQLAHESEVASRRQEARDQRLWETQLQNYIELSLSATHAILWSVRPGDDPKAEASELASKIFGALVTSRLVGRQNVVDAAGFLAQSLIDAESAAEKGPSELNAASKRVGPFASNLMEQLRIATGATELDIQEPNMA